MINKTSPISFNGLKIEGIISVKDMKKLREFANAEENAGFINDLEKTYNTNMVINNTFDEISFSHDYYGNLTNFGCPKYSAEGFYSKVVSAKEGIKHAIKKAEKTSELNKQDVEKMRRGC